MDPQGYDAGKKVTGRKRHILVDTLGLLLSVAVHSADIQDRDGAAFVLNTSTRALFPFIERIFADGGYQGPRAAEAAAATGKWIIEIVKRNELHKFVWLPKRWIVERTLRLDQPQSPPRARFRTLCDHRGRFHSPRDDPPHAAPLDQINPLSMNPNFLDRL